MRVPTRPAFTETSTDMEELSNPTRKQLLRATTDLFVVRKHHTLDEIRQYAEIALRMLPEADATAIAEIARKLAPHPNTPANVLQALMERDEEAATLLLAISPALPGDALEAAAQFGPTDQAVAVACRRHLPNDLVRILVAREENSVWRALAENKSADVDVETLREMARRGRIDAKMGQAVCARTDDPTILQPLFLDASSKQRASMILQAERQELVAKSEPNAVDPVLCGQLEMLARTHNAPGFLTRLAEALQCDRETAARLKADATGEPLAIALASLGMTPEAIVRVFLVGGPPIAHSCDLIEMLHRLASQTSTGAAHRVMRAMLGVPLQPANRRMVHQAVHDQTAAPLAARAVPATTADVAKRRAPLFLFRRRLG